MFENFRERLQTVQQDFTTGFKTLSDKSKDVKVKKKIRREDCIPQFSAGVEVLSRYEDIWETLHKCAKECAKAGEVVDGEVVMLSAHWEKRHSALTQLEEQLQQVPTFLTDLETATSRIAQLEADFEEMESRLMYLENLCTQCEQQRFKDFQILQLENYKKKKRKELESLKAELDSEHAHKVLEMEHAQQAKLKERQKFFEEAFQQDMEHYLSTGYLQIADRREAIGSMSSMEVNVDMLEQMDLTDVSDHEALDVFLNSGGEDNSAASPVSGGPDQDSLSSSSAGAEISLKVPSRAELAHGLPSSSTSTSTSTTAPATTASTSSARSESASLETEGPDEEEEEDDETSLGDSPVVASDEEDVQPDTTLAALPEPEEPPRVSDDSDSLTP